MCDIIDQENKLDIPNIIKEKDRNKKILDMINNREIIRFIKKFNKLVCNTIKTICEK